MHPRSGLRRLGGSRGTHENETREEGIVNGTLQTVTLGQGAGRNLRGPMKTAVGLRRRGCRQRLTIQRNRHRLRYVERTVAGYHVNGHSRHVCSLDCHGRRACYGSIHRCPLPVFGQRVDCDPLHLVVAQGVGRKAHPARSVVTSDSGDGVEPPVNFHLRIRMILVTSVRTDDVGQRDAFALHRGLDCSGRLLLWIVLARVRNSRHVEHVQRVVDRVVPMPQLLLEPGRLRILLRDLRVHGGFRESRTRCDCRPQACMMYTNVPGRRAAH